MILRERLAPGHNPRERRSAVFDSAGEAVLELPEEIEGTHIVLLEVHGEHFDGAPIAAENSTQTEPQLVTDGSGGAILVWLDFRTGYNWDVYAQRLDASGNELWPSGGISICTQTDHQTQADVVPDGSGGAVIVWSDTRNGIDDIYGQRVNATGGMLWATDGVVICDQADSQSGPVITTDGFGGAIIAWLDDRTVGKQEIYAQRVGASGNRMWLTEGVIVATSVDNQLNAMIVADEVGGAYISWRTTQYDIYAQRLNASGSPRWGAAGYAN